MRSIFIYSLTLKHFVSKSLSSTESRSKHTPSGNMCSGSWSSKKHPPFLVFNLKQHKQQQKPHGSVAIRRKRLRLRRRELITGRARAETMEMVNLKLYLENRCIIAENERLRERATALHRENLALRDNLSKTVAQAELPAAGAGTGAP